IIDESSPLHALALADMERDDSRFSASIVCIDTVIPAPVQAHYAYTWKDVRVNHRFVEVYTQLDEHSMTVDYARIHVTEPIPVAAAGSRTRLEIRNVKRPWERGRANTSILHLARPMTCRVAPDVI